MVHDAGLLVESDFGRWLAQSRLSWIRKTDEYTTFTHDLGRTASVEYHPLTFVDVVAFLFLLHLESPVGWGTLCLGAW